VAISEKLQLLCKYDNIPSELTISAILTEDELRYVGDESFLDLMLTVILPKVVAEDVDFYKLFEIDFNWICRCLRILSFGPIYTTNSIFCDSCHNTTYGEYKVNLNSVKCIPIPDDTPEIMRVSKHEFIDFDKDIFFKLPTIGEIQNMMKNQLFIRKDTVIDALLGRLCCMITCIGDQVDISDKSILDIFKNKMISADYQILRAIINQMTNFGLESCGKTQCPRCKSIDATFIALPDDRYYVRPWELHSDDQTVTVAGVEKTYREVRQQLYENIIDETLFISRASESAVSADWLMTQPIFVRKKYVESFTKELQEREKTVKNAGSRRLGQPNR